MHLHISSHPGSQFKKAVKLKLCVTFMQMNIQQVLSQLYEIHSEPIEVTWIKGRTKKRFLFKMQVLLTLFIMNLHKIY